MDSPIKLISTDFDGTLFAEFETPPIPAELQELIARLQAGGAKWVINTGREMASLMEALTRAGSSVEPDYLVLVEREIHLHKESQYVGLDEWNLRCGQLHAELFSRIRADLPKLIDWIKARYHTRIYEDLYSPLCLVAGDNGEMDAIHAYLDEYCVGVPGLAVVRNDVYARFCHTGYNKGLAMAELARRQGVGPENVFAAGDHLNDLPMLSRHLAHYLAAPANAIPQVQETVRGQGGYVSVRSHGRGVAEAIKFYLGERPV